MTAKRRFPRAIPTLTALLLMPTACGEPLVTGAYLGEPLLELSGRVVEGVAGDEASPTWSSDRDADSSEVELAVFWAQEPSSARTELVAVSGVEQQVQAEALILRYSLTLHAPPPTDVLARPLGGQGLVALGMVVAYLDLDGSGTWDADQDIAVGGVPDSVIAYTPDGANGRNFAKALAPGFTVLESAGCRLGDPVMRLVASDPSDLDLVVDLDVETTLYLDLDCDGDNDEWLGARCPPPNELERVCGGQTDVRDDEFCAFCAGFTPYEACRPELSRCAPDTPPHLCEPYQRCLNPDWQPAPWLVCEHDFQRCVNEQPAHRDQCEQGFRECESDVAGDRTPPPER